MSYHYGSQPPSYPSYTQAYPIQTSYANTNAQAYGSTSMAPNLSQQSNSSRSSNDSGYSNRRRSGSSSSYGGSPEYSPSTSYQQSGQPSYIPTIAEYPHSSQSHHDISSRASNPNPPAPTTTTTPKATPYHCLHPGCCRQFARSYDLTRHSATHFPEAAQRYDCPERWCGRTGDFGFTRPDHLKQHRRTVHMKDIPKGKKKS